MNKSFNNYNDLLEKLLFSLFFSCLVPPKGLHNNMKYLP